MILSQGLWVENAISVSSVFVPQRIDPSCSGARTVWWGNYSVCLQADCMRSRNDVNKTGATTNASSRTRSVSKGWWKRAQHWELRHPVRHLPARDLIRFHTFLVNLNKGIWSVCGIELLTAIPLLHHQNQVQHTVREWRGKESASLNDSVWSGSRTGAGNSRELCEPAPNSSALRERIAWNRNMSTLIRNWKMDGYSLLAIISKDVFRDKCVPGRRGDANMKL